MYSVRSLGHYLLEAASISQDTVTLVDVDDVSSLTMGDEVHGYLDDHTYDVTLFYVTDVTDTQIALQDTATSFGYIRDKESIVLSNESKESE